MINKYFTEDGNLKDCFNCKNSHMFHSDLKCLNKDEIVDEYGVCDNWEE